MKMTMTIHIDGKKVFLRRLHSKLFEIITWEVLNEDKQIRIGIIRLMNDQYLTKTVGWQKFKVKYWMGSKFWKSQLFIGMTRNSVIKQMLAS